MARLYTTQIDEKECIGDSLDTINENSLNLDTAIQLTESDIANNLTLLQTASGTLQANINTRQSLITVNDTNTVDLTLTPAGILTGSIKNDSIRYSNLASWQSLSATSLSAEAVQPRLAKAWVRFNGTVNPPTITESFRVASVTKNATGSYTINFIPGTFINTNYSAFISCDNWPNVIGGANIVNYTPSYDSSNTTSTFQQINSYKILSRTALTVGDTISPTDSPSTYIMFITNSN